VENLEVEERGRSKRVVGKRKAKAHEGGREDNNGKKGRNGKAEEEVATF
jgi:hypothetical protein